jgi:hypothetical protein
VRAFRVICYRLRSSLRRWATGPSGRDAEHGGEKVDEHANDKALLARYPSRAAWRVRLPPRPPTDRRSADRIQGELTLTKPQLEPVQRGPAGQETAGQKVSLRVSRPIRRGTVQKSAPTLGAGGSAWTAGNSRDRPRLLLFINFPLERMHYPVRAWAGFRLESSWADK